jgi:hypothetical protein
MHRADIQGLVTVLPFSSDAAPSFDRAFKTLDVAYRSKRIDVVGDRDLAQYHLANDVGELDVIGINVWLQATPAPRGLCHSSGRDH